MAGGTLSTRLARATIRASHCVPRFRPRPAYSSLPPHAPPAAKFRFEFDDSSNFIENFPDLDIPALVQNRYVLDFGSGYGGRTAWLSQWAREVTGIEIVDAKVRAAVECTQGRWPRCRFSLGRESEICAAADWYDVIVSFDVLEHVERPDLIVSEWYRVLRPGGVALIIFTPYEGAFAHHLNYISLAPGLHWLFRPDTLMTAVRQLVEGPLRSATDVPNIMPAHTSYLGERVLPTLNGLTKRRFEDLVHGSGFEIEQMTSRPLLEKWRVAGQVGAAVNRALCRVPGLDARLAHNLTAVLRKRARLGTPSGGR
jgi:2-polyprenyl-3-methyl-5-hydroxy-6-metoxy-1,4-benzoquinol methylase